MDVLTAAQRRLNMSRIRGKDTKPEMLLRRGLHGRGLRFRLHVKGLPGRPDIVFPKYGAVLLVHGCFWHGHGCALSRLPETRREFWSTKIRNTRIRDEEAARLLVADGWRVLTVWECALRGRNRRDAEGLLIQCESFVKKSNRRTMVIDARIR
jgi:DNA mismatch endonuclease, patch repair protein